MPRRMGCVFVVKGEGEHGARSDAVAKLRMLLVDPQARGSGLGARLTDACMAFARERGYTHMTLWTNEILQAARSIYERRGFKLVKTERHHSFGLDLVGQYWRCEL